MTGETVTREGVPMSLYVNSQEEIWNSAYMREVRRAMLAGERLKACEVCYRNEAATGQSYRKSTGLHPVPAKELDQAALARAGEATGYRVDQRPSFLKLEVGNLCNLKCRTCYAGASSQIERDYVHSRWNGGIDPLHAVWRGATAVVGPQPLIGVRQSGFYKLETDAGVTYRWTTGSAVVDVPIGPSNTIVALEMSFHPRGVRHQGLQIFVNDRMAFDGRLDQSTVDLAIDLAEVPTGRSLRIEIRSETASQPGDSRHLGVPVSTIRLRRLQPETAPGAAHPELLWQRFTAGKAWHANDDLIFDELLSDTRGLERLYITGGEPLINDRVFEILEYLIASGAAIHIDLEFSTNCTRVDSKIVDLLQRFRKTRLYLSLDGVGSDYEYIRYPARWKVIEENVRWLTSQGQFYFCVTPVIQIYNVMGITNLCRFCDSLDLGFSLENLVLSPSRLSIDVLPPAARLLAAARLRSYAGSECRSQHRGHVLALAEHLESSRQPPDSVLMREFMLFTNDLDATRAQSFRDTYPELHRLIVEDGFEWTDEKLFVTEGRQAIAVDEGIYAWL